MVIIPYIVLAAVAALHKVKSEGQDAVLDSFVASIRSAVRQNGGKGNHA